MVGTRRKSKAAAAAAAAAEHDHDGASTQGTDDNISVTGHSFSVPLPSDMDIDALVGLLPEMSLTNPSPETIVSVYRLLLAQVMEADAAQRDLEEARAEAERKEIELDQSLQDSESKTKDLENALESVQSQLTTVKNEREQIAASKAELEVQLSTVNTSHSTSSTELEQLRHRIEDAEREKRDLIGVVNRLKEDSIQRDEEIQKLRTSLREARQEHQNFESQARELRSTETSNKFKIESLTQQLQLSQAETERCNKEVNAKSEEYAKYRRTKHAEIAQLQSSLDSITQTHASTEHSFKALQSAYTTQSNQLTQAQARVQDLTGQLAEQEALFSSEVSGLRRLVTMMEEREQKAKEIVDSIEEEWAGVGERTAKREAALKAETEKEMRAREEVEKRLEQLEIVLERVNRGELPVPGPGASVPGTPSTPARGGRHDFLNESMFGLSPTVAMVSKAQRSGKTFTEVYADYVQLQDDFAKKSAEYDHMDRTLSAVLAQIEERAPILSQQREEYERLQSEASQLAAQLATALADRDANASSARDASQKLKKSSQENELLQRQLDDLGRQVQELLRELTRRGDSSIPPDEELEGMPAPPAENIDAVITNNLVLFRSIVGLQEQNQKLLKIVRELGSKMESEEREYREAMELEQSEAVREAHEAIQDLATQLERQKKSSEVTVQAYMKERDALKSMLARSDRVPVPAITNGDIGEATAAVSPDLAAELKEVQTQFESYKAEMGVDSIRLREDLVQAQREVGQINASLAKANAKIEYLNDRQRMSQEQLVLQGHDLDNLTKRNQQLYDQYTRIDIEYNRASEELMVATSRVEQLRNESANLRAEKKIWESAQSRLSEENKILAVERSHLADLMANVQRMHNDLERSGENDRRRLESQIETMESQTHDLKSQLQQERDTVRHMSLQKELDLKEMQSRLDKATEQLSQARESLAGAEATKTHLQERVDQMTRQLQGNEEKLAVYERRPSASNSTASAPDQNISRELQLEQEVAELRSALKVAEVDLAAARNHMRQFQEISQANESALTALNSTHDEYKAETEARIVRQESEYNALQEKLRSVEQDVLQSTSKLTELQRTFDGERTAWANDKKLLEGTIVDMSSSERTSESDRTSRENEVRQQEARALAAEERYSREVLAHADSIKAIEGLKQELSSAQTTSRENIAAAANAQAKLEASEGSWRQQRETLDKEVADLNTRCKDLAAQNKLLHQHLESVSSQAARIRQAADSSAQGSSEVGDRNEDDDTKLSELRSVVAYLRKEKEIVDLQLELSKQENVRLKAQIEHLSQTLQETRSTLSEERERAMEAATSDAQHTEMLERINQLNILRESNATLRTDCEAYSKRSRELEVKLTALSAELDPAKEEARTVKAELVARDVQIKRLEDESRHWQERNTQLLSTYDRVDPADIQNLRGEVETLKSEKAELEKAMAEREEKSTTHEKRISLLEENIRRYRDTLGKANEMTKRLREEKAQLSGTITELQTKVDALSANQATADASKDLSDQLTSLRQEKEAVEKALADEKAARAAQPSSTPSPEQTAALAALREERDRLLSEKEAWTKASTDSLSSDNGTNSQWETEKAELVKARDEALAQTKFVEDEVKKSAENMRSLRQSNEKFQARVSEFQKARERASAEQAAAVAAAVEKVKSEMQAADLTAGASEELAKKHAAELETLRAQLTAQHETSLKEAVESAVAAAKAEATSITDADDKIKAAVDAAIAAHDPRKAEEVAAAVDSGRRESLAKLKIKDGQLFRLQARLKQLETQIDEWCQAGLVPDILSVSTGPTAPAAPIASTSKPIANGTPAVAPSPTTSAPITSTPVASTPAKPATSAPAVAPSTAPSAGVRKTPVSGAVPLGHPEGAGRGRGVPRGGVRGVARGLSIRGAAPGRGGAPSPTTAPAATAGVSIMGAATKRPRDEEAPSSDDSLVKRMKPASEATAAATSKPVTLRRPPPPS